MKKALFTIVFLLGAVSTMFGQQTKSYVTLTFDPTGTTLILSGEIPSSMKSSYKSVDVGMSSGYYADTYVGKILNLLAENGFTVEQTVAGGNYSTIICSKSTSSTSSVKAITIEKSDDGDVTEVARYNLQGIPVTSADKGVQIIVYSNYTTKTVVVE